MTACLLANVFITKNTPLNIKHIGFCKSFVTHLIWIISIKIKHGENFAHFNGCHYIIGAIYIYKKLLSVKYPLMEPKKMIYPLC